MSISQKELIVKINKLKEQINTVFVGKPNVVHNLIIGFFSGLHVLIEDIPGVGKTTLAKVLSRSTGLDFGRIQFTPDLLPGDILGMTVWSVEKKEFIFKKGAIMHQFILADEINRASARTQSSMLEAMQEGSATIDDKTYYLPQPFFVIATQNPSDFAGTFKLPEAQVDRFGVSFSIGYPFEDEELIILERFKEKDPLDSIKPVISPEEIILIRDNIRLVHSNDIVNKYLVNLANLTRKNSKIRMGISPRATQHLLRASQCEAFMSGRDFIIPEDVIKSAVIVLAHRIILSGEAKMENQTPEDIISYLISQLSIPTGM